MTEKLTRKQAEHLKQATTDLKLRKRVNLVDLGAGSKPPRERGRYCALL
ncbi:hypothetical protein [Bradyrhizobium sp. 2S1]|nr:hypothetical protein [Bradyrhizobium sp. 2S1]MCK7670959.1 hypothetical protein [Bradyrhizobium sp. 2S1]